MGAPKEYAEARATDR